MKEGWMKNDEGWLKNDEGWKMNDEWWWFQAVEGFWSQTDKLMDICEWRVAFATDKHINLYTWVQRHWISSSIGKGGGEFEGKTEM